MTRSAKAWLSYIIARLSAVAADAAIVAFSYFAAFALRLDFNEPVFGWRAVGLACITVCAVNILALASCGCYKLSWRRFSSVDVPRFILASALACVVLTLMRVFMPSVSFAHMRPPYSITAMSFFFSAALIVGARALWRLAFAGRENAASLIEREERSFDNSAAARFLAGKVVAITGAGGSIGSELSRQAVAAGAAKTLLIERCENALYEIHRALAPKADVVPVMLDAGDAARMADLFAKFKPDIVLHAAACKHVPMVELNPDEGWRNNVDATRALAEVAAKAHVRRFVLISTDKAVNPVSVMGRSKRAAEEIVMAMQGDTSFCAVRFGNVFGSSGSVVPLFREQIAKGGPVTVTHPEMRRYFMTVQEAASLVLQAASRDEHAIYTLDMGESVNILDLAESMISSAGYRPYVDIPIVFTGIRPGEKLFEELDISEKSCFRTDMAKIYITRKNML